MIITKQLLTGQDFKSLKQGDVIACEWDFDKANLTDEVKLGSFGVYKIKNINGSEITVKQGAYFDYSLFLKGKSKLLGAVLIKSCFDKDSQNRDDNSAIKAMRFITSSSIRRSMFDMIPDVKKQDTFQ